MSDLQISSIHLLSGLSYDNRSSGILTLIHLSYSSGEENWEEAFIRFPVLDDNQFLSETFQPNALIQQVEAALREALLETDISNLTRFEQKIGGITLSLPIREIVQPEESATEEEVKSSSLRALLTSVVPDQPPEPPQIIDKTRPFSLPFEFLLSLTAQHIQTIKMKSGVKAVQAWMGVELSSQPSFATSTQILSPVNQAKKEPVFNIGTNIFFIPPSQEVETVYGKQAQKMQAYLRDLKKWIVHQSQTSDREKRPGITLLLNGAFSSLYSSNLGRQLGAVFGFSKAASPLQLQIFDPILAKDLDETVVQIKSLQKLIVGRKLDKDVQLGLQAQIRSAEAITLCLEHGDITLISILPSQFSSFAALIEALNHLKQAETTEMTLNLSEIRGDHLMSTMLDIVDWYRPDWVFPPKRFINFCNSLIMKRVIEK